MSLFDPNFLAGLEYLALVARRRQAGAQSGGAAGRKLGDGLEFADHRDYVFGDEPRYIDWPAYGRLGRLFVRLFHQHTDQIVHVLVDGSASMVAGAGEHSPVPIPAEGRRRETAEPAAMSPGASKFDAARRIAAALAYLALNNLDRASVAAFRSGRAERVHPTARGRDQIFGLMKYLEGLAPAGPAGTNEALREFAARTGEPGTVVVIGDFLDAEPIEPGLDALRSRGHDVLGVQMLAPSEIDPTIAADLRGRLRLEDAETGAAATVPMTASLARAYVAEAEAHAAALAAAFAGRQAALVRTNSAVPTDAFVLELIRRGLAAGA
jgi:uncharacterized protein (DUF58 family)